MLSEVGGVYDGVFVIRICSRACVVAIESGVLVSRSVCGR